VTPVVVAVIDKGDNEEAGDSNGDGNGDGNGGGGGRDDG
jgi:hypothetical protein